MFREWREKGFFEEFERELERMNQLIERMTPNSEPMVYGFSMHIGTNGVPHIEQFGNLAPVDRDVREPFTSTMVDEKKKELRITAQMPGIDKENIEVNAAGDGVVIKGGSKYYKKVETPAIDPDSAKAQYNNGILEVTLRLKKPEGKAVKIE